MTFEQILPFIVTTIVFIGTNIPFLNKRVVQDKNIIKTFEDVKGLAKKVGISDATINQALIKTKIVTEDLQRRIGEVDAKVNASLQKIDQRILDFVQSDIYRNMQDGLATLDQMKELLNTKDETINMLGNVIKETNALLTEIKQKVG